MSARRIGHALLAALLTVVALAAPSLAQARRLALVIGNADYTVGQLRNPLNDARAMEQKLGALGFTVQRVDNLKRAQIGRTTTAFANAIRPGDEVVFFYAGHGVQVKGVNYLPAVDADIQSEDDVPLNSLNVNALLERLDEAKAGIKLIFLDACRNNPYARSFRSGDRGLARVGAAPSGTLIHFATRPGSVAADGSGANGLYTTQLLQQIDQPGVPVEIMLKRVSAGVEAASQGTQEPWTEGNIRGDFYFRPAGSAAPANVVEAPRPTAMLTPPAPIGELVVRIGHVGPTSGPIAHLGKDNENGAVLAIEDLNARGLRIGGRTARFELITKDDAADPRTATRVATELVDARVAGVVGHLNSGTSIPAAAIYAKAGIPQISPSSTNPKLTRMGLGTTFRVVLDDYRLGEALAEHAARSLGVRTVAIVDDRTAYGQGIADTFERRAKALGLRVTAREFTNDKATDLSAVAGNIRSAGTPDLVFFGGMDSVAGPLLRDLGRAGVRTRLMGGDGICSSELPKLAGVRIDGDVLCAEAGGVEAALKPAMQQFQERFRRRFGTDVQVYAPSVYDAVMVLADAMVRAGSADPQVYASAIAKTSLRGVTGPLAFDERGDLRAASFTVYTFRGATRESLGVYRATP